MTRFMLEAPAGEDYGRWDDDRIWAELDRRLAAAGRPGLEPGTAGTAGGAGIAGTAGGDGGDGGREFSYRLRRARLDLIVSDPGFRAGSPTPAWESTTSTGHVTGEGHRRLVYQAFA